MTARTPGVGPTRSERLCPSRPLLGSPQLASSRPHGVIIVVTHSSASRRICFQSRGFFSPHPNSLRGAGQEVSLTNGRLNVTFTPAWRWVGDTGLLGGVDRQVGRRVSEGSLSAAECGVGGRGPPRAPRRLSPRSTRGPSGPRPS